VLSAADSEAVVLFCCGAVRFLDSLLASPQQPIEDVLAEEEIIRSEIANYSLYLFSVWPKGFVGPITGS